MHYIFTDTECFTGIYILHIFFAIIVNFIIKKKIIDYRV